CHVISASHPCTHRLTSSSSFFFIYCSADHRNLHSFPNDALPISALRDCLMKQATSGGRRHQGADAHPTRRFAEDGDVAGVAIFGDRKSTRLNSSHVKISYAVFCLKKKKNRTSL